MQQQKAACCLLLTVLLLAQHRHLAAAAATSRAEPASLSVSEADAAAARVRAVRQLPTQAAKPTIIAIGDGLTEGAFARKHDGWGLLMQERYVRKVSMRSGRRRSGSGSDGEMRWGVPLNSSSSSCTIIIITVAWQQQQKKQMLVLWAAPSKAPVSVCVYQQRTTCIFARSHPPPTSHRFACTSSAHTPLPSLYHTG